MLEGTCATVGDLVVIRAQEAAWERAATETLAEELQGSVLSARLLYRSLQSLRCSVRETLAGSPSPALMVAVGQHLPGLLMAARVVLEKLVQFVFAGWLRPVASRHVLLVAFPGPSLHAPQTLVKIDLVTTPVRTGQLSLGSQGVLVCPQANADVEEVRGWDRSN